MTTIPTPHFRLQFDMARDPYAARNALGIPNNGYTELTEIANPAAPATNGARLYVRDNGAGKTQLVVRFPTGAIQVLATEP